MLAASTARVPKSHLRKIIKSHFGHHPWSQWKFLYTPSDIWQQRNCSDCLKKMFCTESKSQSPNYSTRNLRISSHILSLSAQGLAQQVQQEANWAPAAPAGLPWSHLNAQKCPVPLWTSIKAAQAELSGWLSSSTDTQSSTELLARVQSLQLHYRAPQKLYVT